jgi:hypothetical protein
VPTTFLAPPSAPAVAAPPSFTSLAGLSAFAATDASARALMDAFSFSPYLVTRTAPLTPARSTVLRVRDIPSSDPPGDPFGGTVAAAAAAVSPSRDSLARPATGLSLTPPAALTPNWSPAGAALPLHVVNQRSTFSIPSTTDCSVRGSSVTTKVCPGIQIWKAFAPTRDEV